MYDQQPVTDPNETLDISADAPAGPLDVRVEEASSKYLASWNHLVSTTNWEKGRIISEWREALQAVGAPASECSDEAWSRRVGNVTPQHVGRLRRVFSRFHKTYKQYKGLYWSHFQAALDWDDAEMWLEGAAQSDWSVSAMRESRWEAVGAPADQKPRDEDVILAELDEDVRAVDDSARAGESSSTVSDIDDATFEDEDLLSSGGDSDADMMRSAAMAETAADEAVGAPVRPFEDLPELPPDVHEAFEAMKLAIINHKMSGWRDMTCDDLLAALNALKQLALAPSDG